MMICPRCRSEYRDGFNTCADCYGPLVVASPETVEEAREPEPEHDDRASVPVFESSDPGLVLLAESVLEGAEIEFGTRGEGIPGNVVVEVGQKDAADAAALLADLVKSAQSGESESTETSAAGDESPAGDEEDDGHATEEGDGG
jgi:hypothetical protein